MCFLLSLTFFYILFVFSYCFFFFSFIILPFFSLIHCAFIFFFSFSFLFLHEAILFSYMYFSLYTQTHVIFQDFMRRHLQPHSHRIQRRNMERKKSQKRAQRSTWPLISVVSVMRLPVTPGLIPATSLIPKILSR